MYCWFDFFFVDILSKIYDNQKFKDIKVIDLRQENLVIVDG